MGPYALALSKAISNAGAMRTDPIKGPFTGYRGLTMTHQELNKEFVAGKYIALKNYTSMSLDKKIAESFAFPEKKDSSKESVVMVIHMKNESGKGKYYFDMSKECYTMYPKEKEILLLQGIEA